MKFEDLPKNLQVEGVQMYTGQKVVVKLNEKQCQSWEQVLLPRLLERERESKESA